MKETSSLISRMLLTATALFVLAGCSSPETVPTYALQPGMKFIYTYIHHNSTRPKEPEEGTMTFWVANSTEDGVAELYFRLSSDNRDGRSPYWGKFYLRPDGSITAITHPRHLNVVRYFLPVLPCLKNGLDREYKETEYLAHGRVHNRHLSGFPKRYCFAVDTDIEGTSRIVKTASTVTWSRDHPVPSAVIQKCESPGYTGRHVARLSRVGNTPQKEKARLFPDFEYYFAATREFEEGREAHRDSMPALYEAGACEDWVRQYDLLIDPLQHAWREIQTPELRKELELIMDRHYYNRARESEEALLVLKSIGQPAPDWELEDYAGVRHRLADYRGKVVLLNFWASWCGYCIQSFPAIKAIVERFGSRPFVLLGMNTDDASINVKFMMDYEAEMNSRALKATSVEEAYHVNGIPTFMVIDATGIMRYNRSGYNEKVNEALIQTIERYLP